MRDGVRISEDVVMAWHGTVGHGMTHTGLVRISENVVRLRCG